MSNMDSRFTSATGSSSGGSEGETDSQKDSSTAESSDLDSPPKPDDVSARPSGDVSSSGSSSSESSSSSGSPDDAFRAAPGSDTGDSGTQSSSETSSLSGSSSSESSSSGSGSSGMDLSSPPKPDDVSARPSGDVSAGNGSESSVQDGLEDQPTESKYSDQIQEYQNTLAEQGFTSDDYNIQTATNESGQTVLEATPTVQGTRKQLAQQLSQQYSADFTADDIIVRNGRARLTEDARREIAGDRTDALVGLGFGVTANGGLQAPKQGRTREGRVRENALVGLGVDVTASGGLRGPKRGETRRERQASEKRVRALEGLGFEGVGANLRAPNAPGRVTYRTQKYVDENRESLREDTAASLEEQLRKRGTDVSLTGADVTISTENGRVQTSLSDRGREKVQDAGDTERFGDVNWANTLVDTAETQLNALSSGITGQSIKTKRFEDDPVEQALTDASNTISDTGRSVGEAIFAPGTPTGESALGPVIAASGHPGLAKDYENALRTTGEGLVQGASEIVNIPGLVKTGLEGVEFAGYVGSETASGNAGEVASQTAQAGEDIYQAAASEPFRTGGVLAGALAGSSGILRAASRVGPRAGLAARLAIQPGEEAAGYSGYYLTKAARGEKAAERWFPNKEPLIVSEEAGIGGAKRAAGRARREIERAKNQFEDFNARLGTRGQLDLTGARRTEVETETSETSTGSEDSGSAFDQRSVYEDKTDIEERLRRERNDLARQQYEQKLYEQQSIYGGEKLDKVPEYDDSISKTTTSENDIGSGISGRLSENSGLYQDDFSWPRSTESESTGLRKEAESPQARTEDAGVLRQSENTDLGVGESAFRTQPALGLDTRRGFAGRQQQAVRPSVEFARGLAQNNYADQIGAGFARNRRRRSRANTRSLASEIEATRLSLENGLLESQPVDTSVDTESRSALDQRAAQDVQYQQETEQESAGRRKSEIESRNELEAELNPSDDEGGVRATNNSGFGQSSGTPLSRGLSAGYYNEFVTAFATGAGPRKAASGSDTGLGSLTEQHLTAAQASGSSETKNAIKAAEGVFGFEGLAIDDSGDGGLL